MSFLPLVAPLVAMALFFLLMHRAANCAECGTRLPVPRMPSSLRQAFWGGWTCPNCGAELNGAGETISKPPVAGDEDGTRAKTGAKAN